MGGVYAATLRHAQEESRIWDTVEAVIFDVT